MVSRRVDGSQTGDGTTLDPGLIDWSPESLICLRTVDSTKEEAVRLASRPGWRETLIVADYQTEGKGTRGRIWFAPPGRSLLVSLLIRPRTGIPLERLSDLLAYAVAAGVRSLTGLDAVIKPPNDVMIGGKKVAGVLAEIAESTEGGPRWVLSLGLNVAPIEFPPDLIDRAGTLSDFTPKVPRREELLNSILRNLKEFTS
jgi:BirA family biotin operon repressor/biotin-[acetyl-CoA-carboxylase] ligase